MLSPVQPACLPSSFLPLLLSLQSEMYATLKMLGILQRTEGISQYESCLDAVTPNKKSFFLAGMTLGAVWAPVSFIASEDARISNTDQNLKKKKKAEGPDRERCGDT